MILPKPFREKDPSYLEYIRGLRCLCEDHECVGDVAPHHSRSVGAGGSDYLTLPLCSLHHGQAHQKGLQALEYEHCFDRKSAIIRILIGYIKFLIGARTGLEERHAGLVDDGIP